MYLLVFSGKNWEFFKVQFSVAVYFYILSGKGANQLEVLYVWTLGNIYGNFLHWILFYWSCSPQMYFQQFFFWKSAEVLGQYLKSLFWKIMSWHNIQPIKIRPRFCKLSFLVFAFLSYLNGNHKDTTHP